jgi:deazaflavin-dependent oxidoreductase (nitroreductase family)
METALLTTTGERTFEPSTVSVAFTRTDDGILVVADDESDDDPQWYRNLVADPVVHVEETGRGYDGAARVLAQSFRERAWEKLIADHPDVLVRQERAGRELPLVEILETLD